jgi:hypothetical protein
MVFPTAITTRAKFFGSFFKKEPLPSDFVRRNAECWGVGRILPGNAEGRGSDA